MKPALKVLKRRSVIRINTHQACDVRLEYVPGKGGAYIHFCAGSHTGPLSGFIDDKDIAKLQRFANSAASEKSGE